MRLTLLRRFSAALLVLMAACSSPATSTGPGLQIDGLNFENRSQTPINRIQLLVPATGNFVSCGFIAPGASCASGFPDIAYRGQPVEISWSQGGQEWFTGEINLKSDEQVRHAGSAQVLVVVLAPGSAGALLVDSPR